MYMYPCGGGCRAEAGWYNAGYIFPAAFQSRVNFRSSVQLDQLVPLAPCPPPLPPFPPLQLVAPAPPLPPCSAPESGPPSAPLTTSTGPLLRDWQPQRGSGAAAVSCGHTCGRSPSRPNILQLYTLRLYTLRLYVQFDSVPVICDFSRCCAVCGSQHGPRIHVSRSTPYGLRVSCTVSESNECD